MRWAPNDWFLDKPNDMTIGMEVELIVFDPDRNDVLNSEERLMRVVNKLPDNVYKDYYPYQLELRSDPHDNPQDIRNQMLELYKAADEEFKKDNLYIVPISMLGTRGENVWCGTHIHVRYKEAAENKKFFEKTWGAYPFVLALTDFTKNADVDFLTPSDRLRRSHHIKVPSPNRAALERGTGNSRYADITANCLTKADGEDRRQRLKTVTTLETRCYDTPSLRSHLDLLIDGHFNVFSHIRNDAPPSKKPLDYVPSFVMSRVLAMTQRYGVNKVLGGLNSEICEDLCDMWGMDYPKHTQFEFREKLETDTDLEKKLLMRRFGWFNTNF